MKSFQSVSFSKQYFKVFMTLAFCFFSKTPSAHEDALVLPKGIFRTWAVGAAGEVNQKFNENKQLSGLANSLNQTIPASIQAQSNEELNQLYNALNDFEPGLGDSLYQTNLQATSKVNFNQYVVAQEYGVSSKFSIGVIIPFTRVKTSGSFSADNVSNAEAVLKRVKNTELEPNVRTFQSKLPRGAEATKVYANNIFLEKGYELPTTTTASGLGDIEVGGKYQIFNLNDIFRGATKFGVRLPTTSHRARQAQIFDQSSGDGQMDLAAQYIMEYSPYRMWTLAASVMGTVQLPNKENRYVRAKGETGLPDLTNPNLSDVVTRNLGDKVDTQLATSFKFFNRRFTAELAYNFMAKTKDRYSGSKNLDYASLEQNTSSYSHSLETALSYSTLTDYMAKKFFMPLDLSLAYNNVFYGRNVSDASFYKLTLKAYY